MNHSPETLTTLNKDVHYCHLRRCLVHLMIHVLMEMFVDHLLMARKLALMRVKMFNVARMPVVRWLIDDQSVFVHQQI